MKTVAEGRSIRPPRSLTSARGDGLEFRLSFAVTNALGIGSDRDCPPGLRMFGLDHRGAWFKGDRTAIGKLSARLWGFKGYASTLSGSTKNACRLAAEYLDDKLAALSSPEGTE
jgi:hypothetical protein